MYSHSANLQNAKLYNKTLICTDTLYQRIKLIVTKYLITIEPSRENRQL